LSVFVLVPTIKRGERSGCEFSLSTNTIALLSVRSNHGNAIFHEAE
jgi:hypothetical protein